MNPDLLTPAERDFLRLAARRSLEAAVRGEPLADQRDAASDAGVELEPRLLQPRGAFVTLHAGPELRGCIGTIEGRAPLLDAVVRNARAAGLEDPRFLPVTEAELPGLSLEVSALTPLRPATADEIVAGRHGVLLAKTGRQAVFLPQVATEQGWDRDTLLGHLCLKAGLAPEEWRDGAVLRVFEAEVF